MSARVKVRAGTYRDELPIVGRDDGDSYRFDPDALPDSGITVEGQCAHCRQRYVMHGCAPGGFPCDCCGDWSYGGIDCARCGRFVDLNETAS